MKSLITTLLLLSFGASVCFCQQQLNHYVYTCGEGDSVLLSVDSLTNPGCNYTWYHEGTVIASNTNVAHLFVTDTGRYTVTANQPGGCSSDLSNALIVRMRTIHANDDSARTDSGSPVAIRILDNDSGGCSTINPASIAIMDPPKHGGLNITSGTTIYMPAIGYVGVDSFRYAVSDVNGNVSNMAKVTILIGPAPDNGSGPIQIYPNPASDFLYVKSDHTKIAKILLLTDRGRTIYEKTPVRDITAIDVSSYAQAIYFVRIVYKDGKQYGYKVLVNNNR